VLEADYQQSLAMVDKRTSHRRRPPTSVPNPNGSRGLDLPGPLQRRGLNSFGVWLTSSHFTTEFNSII
jgi:hypothetical protein